MPTLRRVWALLACLAVFSATGAAQELNEAELVDAIVRDGPHAQAIRAAGEVTRHEQLARTVFPNPALAYSREGAGFAEFLQIEQTLPLFGSRAALTRAGLAATAAADAERDARLWLLRADAHGHVAQFLAAQARVQTTRTAIEEAERLIGLLRLREQEGEGSRFDRLRAEQELRDIRQELVYAAARVAGVGAALRSQLPESIQFSSVVGALYRDQPAPSRDVLVARAATARPELRELAHAGERFDHEADAARRARLPPPALIGGLKRADGPDGREAGALVGVTVAIPLFDRGSRDVARWDAERVRVDAERAALAHAIDAEIGRAVEVLALRRRALEEIGEDRAAGEELLRIADVAYREGEVGILELLDAHRTATRQAMRAITLQLEARLAQIELQRAVGESLWP